MNQRQEDLIEQLRQEEASEDTEHVIDWLADSWATFDMLKERFGEARAWQLYTADPSSASEQAGKEQSVPTCVPLRGKRWSGASDADAT